MPFGVAWTEQRDRKTGLNKMRETTQHPKPTSHQLAAPTGMCPADGKPGQTKRNTTFILDQLASCRRATNVELNLREDKHFLK